MEPLSGRAPFYLILNSPAIQENVNNQLSISELLLLLSLSCRVPRSVSRAVSTSLAQKTFNRAAARFHCSALLRIHWRSDQYIIPISFYVKK